MSRVEHDSWKEGDCLCGAGQVTRHVASTDHPFGGADVSFELECPACARDWLLEHGHFVRRSTLQTARTARSNWNAASEAFHRLARRIVDAHFTALALPTRKAELRELERLGLRGGEYRRYTAERSQGRSPGELTFVPTAADLAAIAGPDADELERLAAEAEALRLEADAADRRVERRRVPKR